MKRSNIKKLMSIFIAASISIIALTGCSSNKTSSTSSATSSNNGHAHNKGNRNFNPSAMKTRYETVLKELVADKTITQDQSDKILAEVTQNMNKPRQQNSNQNSNQNGQNSNHANGGNRKNQLSSLVSSGVITQAQADTINQKLRDAMKNSQSNQTSNP